MQPKRNVHQGSATDYVHDVSAQYLLPLVKICKGMVTTREEGQTRMESGGDDALIMIPSVQLSGEHGVTLRMMNG